MTPPNGPGNMIPPGEEPDRFDRYRDRFRNGASNRLSFMIEPDEDAVRWWIETFVDPFEREDKPGLFPEDMAARLSASGPGAKMFRYRTIDPEAGSFELEIIGRDDVGTRIFLHSPVLEIADRRFYQDLVDVEAKYQRRGIGRGLLRDVYRIARLLSLERITLDAEKDGSYAWARAGFVPEPASWINIEQSALWRLGAAERHLSQETIEQVKALLSAGGRDTRLIRQIADLSTKVPTRKPVERDEDRYVTLGEALLAESGARWRGHLVFPERGAFTADEAQTKLREDLGIFEAYVGETD